MAFITGRDFKKNHGYSASPVAVQLFTPNMEIFDYCCDNISSDEFLIAHLAYDEDYKKTLDMKNFKSIFIIRDPRDQLVSRVFYTRDIVPFIYPGLQHLSFNELLHGYMGTATLPEQKFEDLLEAHIRYPEKPKYKAISHIEKFYNAFLPWMNSANCYTTRFEDLVGPHGGGSEEAQLREISNIASHIGRPVSKDEARQIAAKLFGGSGTFKDGKIGKWKIYFDEDLKKSCKEIAGQLLIDLGYEKDFEW